MLRNNTSPQAKFNCSETSGSLQTGHLGRPMSLEPCGGICVCLSALKRKALHTVKLNMRIDLPKVVESLQMHHSCPGSNDRLCLARQQLQQLCNNCWTSDSKEPTSRGLDFHNHLNLERSGQEPMYCQLGGRSHWNSGRINSWAILFESEYVLLQILPSFTRSTHMCTRTHAHTHTSAHAHTCTRTRARALARLPAHVRPHTHTHARRRTQAHDPSRTHAHDRARTHAHDRPRTFALDRPRAHARDRPHHAPTQARSHIMPTHLHFCTRLCPATPSTFSPAQLHKFKTWQLGWKSKGRDATTASKSTISH